MIGGSYVGLEFGQMYRRFGSRVTIVEMGPRLIAREDDDVSQAVQEILANEGIELRLNARVSRGRTGRYRRIRVARVRSRRTEGARVASVAGRGTRAQYGRPWTGAGGHTNGPTRLRHSRRCFAHQRHGYLGDRRLQRPRRVHPHQLQRLRDRRRQSAQRRRPESHRPHHNLRPCSPIPRLAASA